MLRVSVILVLALSASAAAELPEPLLKSFAMRQAMRTAQIRYRLKIENGSHITAHNFECLASDASYMVTDFGDDDGFMSVDPKTGFPRGGVRFGCAPHIALLNAVEEKAYFHIQHSTSLSVEQGRRPAQFDIRAIGFDMVPMIRSLEEVKESLREFHPDESQWSVSAKGRLIEVSASAEMDLPDGTHMKGRTNWILDPDKDFALLSVKSFREFPQGNSEPYGEAGLEYAHIDGRWFPSKCRGWRGTGTARTIRCEYELESAAFDRPEHPKELTVDMLKVPAGAWVGGSGIVEPHCWDGKGPVPFKEWRAAVQADRTKGAELRDLMARNQKADDYRYPAWWYDPSGNEGIEDLPTRPDEWEVYVRRWCMRYDVDDKQRTAARGVLDDCRKEARAVLDKRRPDLEKVAAQLKDTKLPPAKRDAAIAERERLLRPVADVFARLKSRLEPLLRQEQITARTAATQPAAPRRRG